MRVRFVTAAGWVTEPKGAHQQRRQDGSRTAVDRLPRRVADETGDPSSSRSCAEFLFPVFGDRSERPSLLVASGLPFGEWATVSLTCPPGQASPLALTG